MLEFIIGIAILLIISIYIYVSLIVYPDNLSEIDEFYSSLNNRYITNNEIEKINKKYIKTYYNSKKIFLFIKSKKIKEFIRFFSNLEKNINKLNEKFIEQELIDKKEYFDNLLNYPLDEEQRKAVIIDDDVNLIIAGAGSGKTSTIVGKIKYLIETQGVRPENILALSFTNDAVDNMKKRIMIDGVKCSTFHKLGNEILSSSLEHKKTIENGEEERIKKIAVNYLEELAFEDKRTFKEITKLFFMYLHYPDKKDFQDLNENEIVSYGYDLKTIKGRLQEIENENKNELKTFNLEIVKSYQEMIIANFLYINGINYQYEITYKGKCDFPYKPDFYLPDYDIYIEHFGISEDGRARQYNKEVENKYIQHIESKREVHKRNNTNLIETYSYEYKNGTLFENLKRKLDEYNVEFNNFNYERIFKVLKNYKYDNEFEDFLKLVSKFIILFKGNGYKLDKFKDFKGKADVNSNHYLRRRDSILLDIFEKIFVKYEESLEQDNKIDFNDMINYSTDIVKKGLYNEKLKYIIVDEYQDISYTRYALLKQLQKSTGAKLVLVGDDWQSIYRFTGSNLSLFVNYKKYYDHVKVIKINNNYRNNQQLINITSDFIMQNKDGQIKKELKSSKIDDKPIEMYFYKDNMEIALNNAIVNHLKRGCKSILILKRNNNELTNYCAGYSKIINKYINEEIKIEEKTVHGSKGLEADGVIVCGLRNEINGFPNKMEDDDILRYILQEEDRIPYEEERRVFYVALTRSRTKCSLLIPKRNRSEFIEELYYKNKDYITEYDDKVLEEYESKNTVKKICKDFSTKEAHEENVSDIKEKNILRIEVEDTFELENTITNEIETYRIIHATYTYKPVGISKGKYSFGNLKYEKEYNFEREENDISEDCELAKKVLNKKVGDIINFEDNNLEECKYVIKNIYKKS